MKKLAAAILLIAFSLSVSAAPRSTKDIPDLKTALKSGLPVVAEFGAGFCPACRKIKPIIQELAIEQDGKIVFLSLDINEYKDLAKQFKINLIPTIVFYDRNGKVKDKKIGFMSKKELLDTVRKLELNKGR
jgi:thioredoxin 1